METYTPNSLGKYTLAPAFTAAAATLSFDLVLASPPSTLITTSTPFNALTSLSTTFSLSSPLAGPNSASTTSAPAAASDFDFSDDAERVRARMRGKWGRKGGERSVRVATSPVEWVDGARWLVGSVGRVELVSATENVGFVHT
jgi:hypothetical protein